MKISNRIALSVFQFFIETMYDSLKNELVVCNNFIEDVFHDALICTFENNVCDLEPSLSKLDKEFRKLYQIKLNSYFNDRRKYILFESTILDLILNNI